MVCLTINVCTIFVLDPQLGFINEDWEGMSYTKEPLTFHSTSIRFRAMSSRKCFFIQMIQLHLFSSRGQKDRAKTLASRAIWIGITVGAVGRTRTWKFVCLEEYFLRFEVLKRAENFRFRIQSLKALLERFLHSEEVYLSRDNL